MRMIAASVLLVLVARISAQPVLSSSKPMAVAPGEASQVTIYGSGLSGDLAWSLPKMGVVFQARADEALCSITAPAGQGLVAIRAANKSGVSSPLLLWIDDLPTTPIDDRARKLDLAQTITLPIAVEGTAAELSSHFLKFNGHQGQRISVEVIANRIGSRMDPLVRLLDAQGREELVCDDDPAVAPDARFSFTLAATGDHYLEIRDAAWEGSPQHRYRVRIGEFDTTPPPFPLPFTRGKLAAITEEKPNDDRSSASKFTVPMTLNGRFEARGDRDVYQFAAKKGERILARSRTRSLGSPCDLFLRIAKADGSKLADSKNDVPEEASVDAMVPDDGQYLLIVEELAGQGGPGFAYRIDVTLYAGFSLSTEVEKIDVAAGGAADVKVTAVRRDYKGKIVLTIEGAPLGISVANEVIKEGQNDVQLKIRLPVDAPVGKPMVLRILGKATIDGVERVEDVSTMPGLKKLFPMMRYPPQELDGEIGLGVKPPGPTTKPAQK